MTTVFRQAVECEARNPCIHDHDDIKSAEGTTEVFFCRTFGALIFLQSYLQGFRTACFITCLGTVVLTGLFFKTTRLQDHKTTRPQDYKTVSEFRVQCQCQSSEFKKRSCFSQQLLLPLAFRLLSLVFNKSLHSFTVFCNNLHEVDAAI